MQSNKSTLFPSFSMFEERRDLLMEAIKRTARDLEKEIPPYGRDRGEISYALMQLHDMRRRLEENRYPETVSLAVFVGPKVIASLREGGVHSWWDFFSVPPRTAIALFKKKKERMPEVIRHLYQHFNRLWYESTNPVEELETLQSVSTFEDSVPAPEEEATEAA